MPTPKKIGKIRKLKWMEINKNKGIILMMI